MFKVLTEVNNQNPIYQAQTTLTDCWLSCLGFLDLLLPNLEIIGFSNLSILTVPDEEYSRNPPCTLNLISTVVSATRRRKTIKDNKIVTPVRNKACLHVGYLSVTPPN
jgi:hypothetical protein